MKIPVKTILGKIKAQFLWILLAYDHPSVREIRAQHLIKTTGCSHDAAMFIIYSRDALLGRNFTEEEKHNVAKLLQLNNERKIIFP